MAQFKKSYHVPEKITPFSNGSHFSNAGSMRTYINENGIKRHEGSDFIVFSLRGYQYNWTYKGTQKVNLTAFYNEKGQFIAVLSTSNFNANMIRALPK